MKNLVWLTCAVLLGACAAEVPRQQVQFAALKTRAVEVILQEMVTLRLATGYERSLLAGSRWRETGRIAQGVVYRPVSGVLTVEGAHVHEAHLVLDNSSLTGFYLPADRAYSPIDPVKLNLKQGE